MKNGLENLVRLVQLSWTNTSLRSEMSSILSTSLGGRQINVRKLVLTCKNQGAPIELIQALSLLKDPKTGQEFVRLMGVAQTPRSHRVFYAYIALVLLIVVGGILLFLRVSGFL